MHRVHRGPVPFLAPALLVLAAHLLAVAAAQPSPRGYVDMVYVPQVDRVLVFGGQSSPNPPYPPLGGTWWWDPRSGAWDEVTTEPQPSPRSASHLEVHAPTGTVVLFGGGKPAVNGFDTFSETWVFDPFEERWTLLEFDGPTPVAEIGEQFAYHEDADLFVLYGGFTLNGFRVLDDTWHLDLAAGTWERVEPADPPPGRNYNAFGYDPSTGVLVMSGGLMEGLDETWTYDPRTLRWTFMGPREGLPEVPYARFAHVEELDALVRLGGLGADPGTLWRYDVASNAWTVLAAENDGPAVSRHAMVAVPGVGLVVFGGLPERTQAFTDALWVFDPATGNWQQR
jgi:hypothetical protein